MGPGIRVGIPLSIAMILLIALNLGTVKVSSDVFERTNPLVDYDGTAYMALSFERTYKVQSSSVYDQPVLKTWSSGFARRSNGGCLHKFGFLLIVRKSNIDYTDHLVIYPEAGTFKYYAKSNGAGGGADLDAQRVKAIATIICQVLTEYAPIPSFICSVINMFDVRNSDAGLLVQTPYRSPEYAEVGVISRVIGPCSASEGGLTAYFAPHVLGDLESLPEDIKEEVIEDFYGWYSYYLYIDTADTCSQPYGNHGIDITVIEGTCIFSNTPLECSTNTTGGGGICPDPGCDLPMGNGPGFP